MPEFKETSLGEIESNYSPWDPLYLVAIKETPHGKAKVSYVSHGATLRDAVHGSQIRYRWVILEHGLDPEEWNA